MIISSVKNNVQSAPNFKAVTYHQATKGFPEKGIPVAGFVGLDILKGLLKHAKTDEASFMPRVSKRSLLGDLTFKLKRYSERITLSVISPKDRIVLRSKAAGRPESIEIQSPEHKDRFIGRGTLVITKDAENARLFARAANALRKLSGN